MTYTIELDIYQGPLDLLLELIERAELDITKIALAQVTDQYLEHLARLQEHSLEDLASFLVIAARLLQIKSEALLPRPPEREPGEIDPGEALAQQLIAYKKYKQIASVLAERTQAGLRSHLRLAPTPLPEPKLDLSGVELEDLRRAMLEALAASPEKPSMDRVVVPHRVHIRNQIHLILDSLRSKGSTTFWTLLRNMQSRIEIVISFLAMLELIKQRRISVSQDALFADIKVAPGQEWKPDQDSEDELDFELEFGE
ncbi:MAG TPA: segregation/condensation protein A [Anaerolineae bacterium]|nr:segregation/condensation protein A [Anaerolineae bacterium]